MLLSVIIPAYNVGGYLRECLDSVVLQEGIEMEVLVVNDGSTDDTGAIARGYAARYPFVKVIDIGYSGPAVARNKALEEARGDLIAFVDSDDYVLPGAFRLMAQLIKEHDADIVMGRYILTGKPVKKAKTTDTMIYTGHDTAVAMLYQRHNPAVINPSAWGKMFRRGVWDTARFPEGRYYEDLFIVPVVTERCRRVATVDMPVYAYRHNPKGILANFSPRHSDCIEAAKSLRREFAGDQELADAARSRLFSAAFNLLLRINATGSDMPAAKEECKDIIRKYAHNELADRKARIKNRIGAAVQWLPFLFDSKWLCRKALTR